MNLGRFYGSLQSGSQNPTHDRISERALTSGSAREGDVNVEFLSGSDVIANDQDHMNTVMVCDEINKEVKNLRIEFATLKRTIDNISKGNLPCHNSAIPKSLKLPKGLSVRNWYTFPLITALLLNFSINIL